MILFGGVVRYDSEAVPEDKMQAMVGTGRVSHLTYARPLQLLSVNLVSMG